MSRREQDRSSRTARSAVVAPATPSSSILTHFQPTKTEFTQPDRLIGAYDSDEDDNQESEQKTQRRAEENEVEDEDEGEAELHAEVVTKSVRSKRKKTKTGSRSTSTSSSNPFNFESAMPEASPLISSRGSTAIVTNTIAAIVTKATRTLGASSRSHSSSFSAPRLIREQLVDLPETESPESSFHFEDSSDNKENQRLVARRIETATHKKKATHMTAAAESAKSSSRSSASSLSLQSHRTRRPTAKTRAALNRAASSSSTPDSLVASSSSPADEAENEPEVIEIDCGSGDSGVEIQAGSRTKITAAPIKQSSGLHRSLSRTASTALSTRPSAITCRSKPAQPKYQPKAKTKAELAADAMFDSYSIEDDQHFIFSEPSKSKSKRHHPPSSSSSSSTSRPSPSSPLSSQWIDQYEPTSIIDLCVHARKIRDVQNFIMENRGGEDGSAGGRKNMLLLGGPPGSCKSTLIRVLAREMNMEIQTWESTVDATQPYERSSHETYLPYESQFNQFRSFLLRSIKYNTLTIGSDPSDKLILLEDLPFLDHEATRHQFISLLSHVLPRTQSLIVFIITDSNEKLSDQQLQYMIGEQNFISPLVQHISCNSISVSGIRKALRRVVEGEGMEVSEELIDQVVESCSGDVRNAIQALQFECLIETENVNLIPEGHKKKRKAPTTKRRKLSSLSHSPSSSSRSSHSPSPSPSFSFSARDEQYSIFHALGKILYAKPSEVLSAEDIVAASPVEPRMFHEFLHHNFLQNLINMDSTTSSSSSSSSSGSSGGSGMGWGDEVEDLESVAAACESFSFADMIGEASHRQSFGDSMSAIPESYLTSICCRGFMQVRRQKQAASETIEKPVNSYEKKKGFQALRGPESGKVNRIASNRQTRVQLLFLEHEKAEEIFGLSLLGSSMSFYLEVLPFVAMIVASGGSSGSRVPTITASRFTPHFHSPYPSSAFSSSSTSTNFNRSSAAAFRPGISTPSALRLAPPPPSSPPLSVQFNPVQKSLLRELVDYSSPNQFRSLYENTANYGIQRQLHEQRKQNERGMLEREMDKKKASVEEEKDVLADDEIEDVD